MGGDDKRWTERRWREMKGDERDGMGRVEEAWGYDNRCFISPSCVCSVMPCAMWAILTVIRAWDSRCVIVSRGVERTVTWPYSRGLTYPLNGLSLKQQLVRLKLLVLLRQVIELLPQHQRVLHGQERCQHEPAVEGTCRDFCWLPSQCW